jgi:hypothetical protein
MVGHHMKLLYIKGHLNGKAIDKMLVDGGACVNITPVTMFERLCHTELAHKEFRGIVVRSHVLAADGSTRDGCRGVTWWTTD